MTDSSDKEVHTTNPEEFEGQPLKIFEIEGDLWDYDKVAKTVRLLAREFLERFYPSTFIDHERITMLNRLTNSISKDHPVGFGTDLFIPGYPQQYPVTLSVCEDVDADDGTGMTQPVWYDDDGDLITSVENEEGEMPLKKLKTEPNVTISNGLIIRIQARPQVLSTLKNRFPGSAQEFGLNAPFSLSKFDNSVVGLFKNTMGGVNVSRMQGFGLNKLSDQDIDEILTGYADTADASGFSFMDGGHPFYVLALPTADATWVYDGLPNAWSEWTDLNGSRFWGLKFAKFVNRLCVSDYRNGNIYAFNPDTTTDNGSMIPMEVWSKHIWEDDKYLGIQQIQIDIESGVGTLTETDPVMDLLVSKDGGNTFNSVGFAQMGPIGEYTQRVIWDSLGAARDWVLRLRITDNVRRVITGASAEISGGSF